MTMFGTHLFVLQTQLHKDIRYLIKTQYKWKWNFRITGLHKGIKKKSLFKHIYFYEIYQQVYRIVTAYTKIFLCSMDTTWIEPLQMILVRK